MRLYEIDYEFKTKDEHPITFKISEDIDDHQRSLWRIDRIDAFVYGEHAGYIKLSYVSEEKFNKKIRSIFHYMSYKGKHFIHDESTYFKDLDEMQDSTLLRILDISVNELRSSEIQSNKFLNSIVEKQNWYYSLKENLNRNDILKALKIIEKILMKIEIGKDYRRFKEFHIDKPIVDYIRVFSSDDNILSKNKLDDNKKNWLRQRIGMALYIKASQYLESRGLKLYASGIQSDEAQAVWKYFESKGWVKKERGPDKMRKYLDLPN